MSPHRMLKCIAAVMIVMIAATSCQKKLSRTFTVKNNLDADRSAETVYIAADKISDLVGQQGIENVLIRQDGKVLISQPVDNEGDGVMDGILFQTDIKANEEKQVTAEAVADGASQQSKSDVTTYSRFVPERIDDYAWENDRVAFRTYGPKAQQLTESGERGGTLTSGMDCWLKRVSYPVIDQWYKKNIDKAGYYHIDHGEGYDPYHVGNSRGCGGIGVWENDSLYVSKNFVSYKIIASGPIRNIFELTYAPWTANGRTVTEKKIISLDLGSNLSRYEVTATSDQALPNITAGITLHDEKGEVKIDSARGWARYWEPMDSAQLGTGIVAEPATITAALDHRTKVKEQSHVLVAMKPQDGKVVYYAGFGWTKSGQFKSPEEWDQYLDLFSKRLASPLEVNVVQP